MHGDGFEIVHKRGLYQDQLMAEVFAEVKRQRRDGYVLRSMSHAYRPPSVSGYDNNGVDLLMVFEYEEKS